MKQTLGYIVGAGGQFGRVPFYRIRLGREQGGKLDELLGRAGTLDRRTTTLTVTFHQPDRIRITEADAPDYELRAAAQYVRGDVVRVQGKEGVSCGLDISARFGVPLVQEQLRAAITKSRAYIELRVPSRKRDLIEFIPDVEIAPLEEEALVAGSTAAAVNLLQPEDFSDWEK